MNPSTSSSEEFDVVVIGAGISGIGAARYITRRFPGKRVVVLEARDNIGGTWDLFRYPGIRSDSDLHTFGYEFKPWTERSAIAGAPLILDYLRETVAENDLGGLIRLGHRVERAEWSSDDARWTLDVRAAGADGATDTRTQFTAKWVFAGTGYYRYDQGYTPHFDGRDDFAGDVIHPQHWPENYDSAGKNVVVIGSGATAITLVPAMASGDNPAAHVTMLQRTPSYVMSYPKVDSIALLLNRLLGESRGYALTRLKNVWLAWGIVNGLRTFPSVGRAVIRTLNKQALPQGYDVDTHFNPPYDPWDQRLCLSPDGDFFAALRTGNASIVTDRVARFTATGIQLESGRHLDADVIVTATGLDVRLLGGIEIVVDGSVVDLADCVAYRGTLLSGIPNLAVAIGYTTSSWTLKIGILCRYFCDLLAHMDAAGHDSVVAEADPGMATRPVLDLSSGYALRARENTPKQGTGRWSMSMSYPRDAWMLRGPLVDDALRFTSVPDEPGRVAAPPIEAMYA